MRAPAEFSFGEGLKKKDSACLTRPSHHQRWAGGFNRFAHSAGPGISFWRIGVFVSGRSGWSSRVRQVATQNRSKSKNNENQFQEKSKNTNDFCIDFMAILAQFLEPSWLCFEIFFVIMVLGRPQGDFGREPRPILLSRRQVLEPFGGSCRSQIVIFLTSFLRSLLR